MPRKKDIIPEYQSEVFNGKEYFRTRVKDADGKRIALYASTRKELYEKVKDAQREIVCHPNKNGHRKASKNGMNRILSFVFERRPHLFHGSLDNEPLPT